ncbi:hypothetical protein [Paenibacillus sp. 2TAB19]|uniref:hypothetical protein n=1 Tax=Paenibacillus sp. 2TAB19 TaxID=3233003 RepID=UPI003F9D0ADC
MNHDKPDWSAMVKASSIPNGVFTENMKQTVMSQVQQDQRKKMNNPFYFVIITLLGLMICVTILPLIDRLPTNAIMGSEAASDQNILLDYEPTKDLKFIPETDMGVRDSTLLRLPITSVQIKETVIIDGFGKYLNYTKAEEGDTSFFGFELSNHFSSANGEFYEIGYGAMTEVNFQKSDAFGLADLRMDGRCGPQRKCTYWISLDQDVVKVYYQMNAPTIYEQDLDGDGVTEAIIVTDGTQIYIYKNIAGQIQSVNVQSALQTKYGDTVTYDPVSQVFQLTNEDETRRYRYAAGGDKLRQLDE